MANFLPSLQTFAKATFASAVGLSTISVGLLYYGQNYLIYPSAFPPGSRTDVQTPADFGLPYEDLTLDTVDGIKIKSYLLLQRRDLPNARPTSSADSTDSDEEFAAGRPTVVMFHGNGGNAGHRIPLARVFFLNMRCNVLMLSYRGYGHSQGSPSEKGIRIDAQTALDYLTSHPTLSPSVKRSTPGSKIILYGQSIGGAVALDLAARNPNVIAGLILENTFLSIPRLIPSALPLLSPFSFLCHQKWDNANTITKLPPGMSLLMLSGKQDEVVPAAHMAELWTIAQKSGRQHAKWVHFEKGAHNDTCIQPGYWAVVADFVSRIL